MLIAVRGARKAVGVWRRLGCHPSSRGDADVIGNAPVAALQTGALVAAAPPGAAARLMPAIAPEPEQVAYFRATIAQAASWRACHSSGDRSSSLLLMAMFLPLAAHGALLASAPALAGEGHHAQRGGGGV